MGAAVTGRCPGEDVAGREVNARAPNAADSDCALRWTDRASTLELTRPDRMVLAAVPGRNSSSELRRAVGTKGALRNTPLELFICRTEAGLSLTECVTAGFGSF